MTRSPVVGPLALTLVVVAALAGCGDDPAGAARSGGVTGGPTGGAFPASDSPVDTAGVVWSVGTTVHLPDGTDVDLPEKPASYAVGGDGVFVATEDSGDQAGAVDDHDLLLVEPGGAVTEVASGVTDPIASPDGRYLVYLDVVSGEEDEFGTPQAQTVIVDLTSGEEVVRSTEGAGDPSSDDFADLYADAEIGVRAVTDDAAYVDLDGLYRFDLETGDAEPVADDEQADAPGPGSLRSPDGAWRITESADSRDLLAGPGGEEVEPAAGAPRWSLLFWADETTVAGIAIDGPVGPSSRPFSADNTYTLMGCDVPSGRCERIPETTGETVAFPFGDSPYESTTLAFSG